jgi:hypothetical protein
MLRRCLLCLALTVPAAASALDPPAGAPRSPSPAGAAVYFISPVEGAKVKSPLVVRFGLRGMGVAPAGVPLDHTGHHHLLVDVAALPPEGQPLPRDAQHLHFGDGQTETELQLTPGRHTLRLVLGDALHVPHQPLVASELITITVE